MESIQPFRPWQELHDWVNALGRNGVTEIWCDPSNRLDTPVELQGGKLHYQAIAQKATF